MAAWYTRDVDIRVAQMLDSVQNYKFHPAERSRSYVTLAREYGCNAFAVAHKLAQALNETGGNWQVFDRVLLERVAQDLDLSRMLIKSMTSKHKTAFEEFLNTMVLKLPSQDRVFNRIAKTIKGIAWHGEAIIIGRGSAAICADMPGGIHVHLTAPFGWRLDNSCLLEHNDHEQAVRLLTSFDNERMRFYDKFLGIDIAKSSIFDMTCNNSKMSEDEIVSMMKTLFFIRKAKREKTITV